MKRLKWLGLTALLILGWKLITPPLLAQDYDKPRIYLGAANNYGTSGPLLTLSSTAEPKISITSYKANGQAKIEIYNAGLDEVLKYLKHNDKYQQTDKNVDTEKLNKLKELETNLNEGQNEVSLPIEPTGIYFVKATQGSLATEVFVVRSTIGTMAREAKDTLVVWNQDFVSKRSINGAKITLYNLEGNVSKLAETTSDGSGIASVPLSASADLIVTEANNSIAITPLNIKYMNDAHWYAPFGPNRIAKNYFLFNDRPIYQPGDTVYFKAVARDDDDSRYSMPSGSVMVAIGQGYDNENFLYKKSLNFDTNGFIDGSYKLPKNLTPGDYRIVINPKMVSEYWGNYLTSEDSLYFKVENYRKPEYVISTDSTTVDLIRGDQAKVAVKGEYYSGQPLSGAKVNYKIYAQKYGWGDFDYYYPSNGDNYYRAWYGEEIDSGSLELDKKGKAEIEIPSNKNDSQGKYQVFFLEFTYADASGNQTLSGVNVLVRSGEISIYRDPDGGYVWGGKTNQKIEMPMMLRANKSKVNLAQVVEVNMKRRWWEMETNSNSKYPIYKDKEEDFGKRIFKTDANGKGNFSFTPEKEGSYDITMSLKDNRDNLVSKTFSLYINDKYASYGYYTGGSQNLKVNLEKPTYSVGDEAIIRISSEIPDRDVYLAIERGYQDRYQVIQMKGKSAEVPIKIVDHDLPNIYVAAKSFGTEDLDGDIQNLKVDTSGKKINYQINTDKTLYAPGDEVTVTINAKDSSGKPVESNTALWAIDKSIYALADKNYGEIFNDFWSERDDQTQQSHSLENVIGSGGAEKGGCFLPGTQVKMADGTNKSIEEIKKGEEILTYLGSETNKTIKTKVTAIHEAKVGGYLVINGKLKVTDNHLLWVNGKWMMAGRIKVGDILKGEGGEEITVATLEYLHLASKVYNLTTEKYHTYLAEGIYVHNDKGGGARENFADTAYWNASINTNSEGRATVKFKLPDNLTTWVITTIGASTDTKVGQAFAEIKASKDLVIRPALPNVLGESDEMVVSALIHNFTDLETKVTTTFKSDAGKVLDNPEVKVAIGANDFTQVNWRIKMDPGKDNARMEFGVKSDRGKSDTVATTLPVRKPGFWWQQSYFKEGTGEYGLQVPEDFDKNLSSIEINLSPTILGTLPMAMKYLVNYPYGCVEQTTSALTAKLAAKKYPTLFTEALKGMSDKMTIDEGLDKLRGLQNDDGSWGWWWQGSKPEPFVTAYVFRVLNMAKALNYDVDASMYTRARNFLNNGFDQAEPKNKVIKAYGLSFGGDPKYYHQVTELNGLSDDLVAMAAVANITAGLKDNSKNGIDQLKEKAQRAEGGRYWREGEVDRFGSRETTTALAIQALNKSGDKSDLINQAVNYLIKTKSHDYWNSTYATSQSILALADFNEPTTTTTASYRVMLGSSELISGKYGSGEKSTTLNVDVSKAAKAKSIRLEKTGEGQVYMTVNQKWWMKQLASGEENHGAKISKTIVNDKGKEYNFVPGDLVQVTLEVNYDNGTPIGGYALIEDHLPAGLVPVNTNLLNEQTSANQDWQQKQYLKDGVIIPIYYGNNSQTYSYKARVITGGTYYNPPAYFTMMYSPEVWSRSASGKLTVESDVVFSPIDEVRMSVAKVVRPDNLRLAVVGGIFGLILFGLVIRKIRGQHKTTPPTTNIPGTSDTGNRRNSLDK